MLLQQYSVQPSWISEHPEYHSLITSQISYHKWVINIYKECLVTQCLVNANKVSEWTFTLVKRFSFLLCYALHVTCRETYTDNRSCRYYYILVNCALTLLVLPNMIERWLWTLFKIFKNLYLPTSSEAELPGTREVNSDVRNIIE